MCSQNSISFLGLSGLGILNLRFETDGNALWISKESPFLADSKWLKDNFDHDKPRRINSLIIEGILVRVISLYKFFSEI